MSAGDGAASAPAARPDGAAPGALREERIALAYQFLSDPRTKAIPLDKKIQYLESKDHSRDELDAAIARLEAEGGAEDERTPLRARGGGGARAEPAARSSGFGLRSACCAVVVILLVFGAFLLVDETVWDDDDSTTETSSSNSGSSSYDYGDSGRRKHKSRHHGHRSLGSSAEASDFPEADDFDDLPYLALSYDYELVGHDPSYAAARADARDDDVALEGAPAAASSSRGERSAALSRVGEREDDRFAGSWPSPDEPPAPARDASSGGEQHRADGRFISWPRLARDALRSWLASSRATPVAPSQNARGAPPEDAVVGCAGPLCDSSRRRRKRPSDTSLRRIPNR